MTEAQKKDKTICIVGSGLVGTLLAILLAEQGFKIDVYEKRRDPRKDTKTRGRSIALSLSDRGWKALRRAGLEQTVRANTQPAYGRMVHEKDGTLYAQGYGDGSQAIWTVNRNYLNTTLLEKAAATGRVRFFFGQSFKEFDPETNEVIFTNGDIKKQAGKRYDHILGVDGIFSRVRENLEEKKAWAFESSTLEFGYKELRIPPNAQGKHAIPGHSVHIWPRKNSFLIAFPANNGEFICTLFLPLAGNNSLASITNPKRLISFFKKEYQEAIALMPNLLREFFRNAVSTITQVKGGPWHFKDKVALLGDASHAISPFYGMGMNIGFEDCTVFMDLLEKNNYNFGATFAAFSEIRKPDMDAMLDLSYKNLQSISESPDPLYQQKWLLERKIWKLLPQQWLPAYALIVFSETPLREVPAIKDRQDCLLNELVSEYPNALDLPDRELKKIVETMLKPVPVTRLYHKTQEAYRT